MPLVMLVKNPDVIKTRSPESAAFKPATLPVLNFIWMMKVHATQY